MCLVPHGAVRKKLLRDGLPVRVRHRRGERHLALKVPHVDARATVEKQRKRLVELGGVALPGPGAQHQQQRGAAQVIPLIKALRENVKAAGQCARVQRRRALVNQWDPIRNDGEKIFE